LLWLTNGSHEVKIKATSGTFRVHNDITMEQFSSALNNDDWINSHAAINKDNTSLAYDHFIKTYAELGLYNKILTIKDIEQ